MLAAGCLCAPVARADVLFLSNGGQLEGELLNADQSPRTDYRVRVSSGGQLTLPASQVERVVVKSDLERRYETMLPSVPDTVEGHWDMAERCRRAGLGERRDFHLQQVLRLNADHEAARHALGYSRVDGDWLRQEDWMARQGYIRHRGKWLLPQEILIQRREAAVEERVVEWRKKLNLWRTAIVKGRENRFLAEQALMAVRDPHAVPALTSMLEDDKERPILKQAYAKVLVEIADDQAVTVLIRHAIDNPNPRIREICLDGLERLQSPRAVKAFAGLLAHEKNVVVRRAAAALARLKDPTATLPLINALITEHKQVVGGGNGLQTSFSNNGPSGLSVGGRPKVREVKVKNEAALLALTGMHTGVNFGYNQAAWKGWFVREQTPPPVNLRRTE